MNNKMVSMAVLDVIWMGISSAALLAIVAIIGFIAFKWGIVSFKITMDAVKAAKGIENIEGVVKYPRYRNTEEDKDEFEIIVSFIKAEIEKNYYANYYTKYAYKRFKIKLILSYIDSLKSFIESKSKKNFAKYAYIQLFKK